MCGIAGAFNFGVLNNPQINISHHHINAIFKSLDRRGPDAKQVIGFTTNYSPLINQTDSSGFPNFLLHTRLAIIDPQPISDQPMFDIDNRIFVVFNGEIYNWKLLRSELEVNFKSYQFRTKSDTEVLIAGYLAWGFNKLLTKISGMFALAIFDRQTQKIYLARDRLGKKPLLYHFGIQSSGQGRIFAFASMVRALVPLSSYFHPSQQGINIKGVDAFLAHRTIFSPETFYKGINRLAPATAMEVDLTAGKYKIFRYWQIGKTTDTHYDNIYTTLAHAVDTRLSSDRPLGIFLSGGIDSAVIANLIPPEKRGEVLCFTASFSDKKWDESENAKRSANYLGFRQRIIPITPNLKNDFSQIVADFDEPFADPSSLPMWYLAREATKEIKVALSGDGGDEFFGGYKRYRQHLRGQQIFNLLGKFINKNNLTKLLKNINGEMFPININRLLYEFNLRVQNPLASYVLRFSGFAPWQRQALYSGAEELFAGDINTLPIVYWADKIENLHFPHRNDLETLMALDEEYYLPEYILRKGDLATMAHGLEMRQPLLDENFINQIFTLPENERLQKPPTHPKKWLINTLPASLQSQLLNSPKRGFNPPMRKWIANDLAERLPDLGWRINNKYPWINKKMVDECLRVFNAPHNSSEKYHHQKLPERIYQLLILDEFVP